jgi:hypothetical protein
MREVVEPVGGPVGDVVENGSRRHGREPTRSGLPGVLDSQQLLVGGKREEVHELVGQGDLLEEPLGQLGRPSRSNHSSSPISDRILSSSSSSSNWTSSRVIGSPVSDSVRPLRSHCQICEREISAVRRPP